MFSAVLERAYLNNPGESVTADLYPMLGHASTDSRTSLSFLPRRLTHRRPYRRYKTTLRHDLSCRTAACLPPAGFGKPLESDPLRGGSTLVWHLKNARRGVVQPCVEKPVAQPRSSSEQDKSPSDGPARLLIFLIRHARTREDGPLADAGESGYTEGHRSRAGPIEKGPPRFFRKHAKPLLPIFVTSRRRAVLPPDWCWQSLCLWPEPAVSGAFKTVRRRFAA